MENKNAEDLKTIKLRHRQLDWKVKKLENLTPYRDNEIKALKKEKLRLKDLIEIIEN